MAIDRLLVQPAQVSKANLLVMVAFYSVACYNALETLALTFEIFKRPCGLYFWSIQITTWGVLVYVDFVITGPFSFIPTIPAGAGLLIL